MQAIHFIASNNQTFLLELMPLICKVAKRNVTALDQSIEIHFAAATPLKLLAGFQETIRVLLPLSEVEHVSSGSSYYTLPFKNGTGI